MFNAQKSSLEELPSSAPLLSSTVIAAVSAAATSPVWRDENTFTLAPGDSAECKLVMTEGQIAEYRMLVECGRVNFDLQGHGGGQSVSYEKGRGSTGDEGEIADAFDGEHGWFWRNRDSQPATATM